MQRRGLTPLCHKIQGAYWPDGEERSQGEKMRREDRVFITKETRRDDEI